MQSRINDLPVEMLKHILTFAFPDRPMQSSTIHMTCTHWYSILGKSVKQLHEVNAILKKMNARHQSAKQKMQAWAEIDDEVQKIYFRNRCMDEFKSDVILLADQLEMLALPSAINQDNAYAQLLMFNLHGSHFFAEYIDVEEGMNYLSEVIPFGQKNPVKAYYYLGLAAKQNTFAQELWQRITLSPTFYNLVEKEIKSDTESPLSRFAAILMQEKNNELSPQEHSGHKQILIR